MLNISAASEEWQVYEVFSRSPRLFQQLYSLHVEYNGKYIPVAYAVSTNKTAETYQLFYNVITFFARDHGDLKSKNIMLDYEQAAIKAAKQSSPQTNVICCFFHLKQSVLRKVISLELRHQYGASEAFELAVKQLTALAFVPTEYFPKTCTPLQTVRRIFFPHLRIETGAVPAHFVEYVPANKGKLGQNKYSHRIVVFLHRCYVREQRFRRQHKTHQTFN